MLEQMRQYTSHEAPPMQKLKQQHKPFLQLMKANLIQSGNFPDQIDHPKDIQTGVQELK